MRVIHKVRLLMESNEYLEKLVPVIQSTKIMQQRVDAYMLQQAIQNDAPAFRACYAEHKDKFEKLAGMLADDFSRATMRAVIDYRLAPASGKLGGGSCWTPVLYAGYLWPGRKRSVC